VVDWLLKTGKTKLSSKHKNTFSSSFEYIFWSYYFCWNAYFYVLIVLLTVVFTTIFQLIRSLQIGRLTRTSWTKWKSNSD